MNNSQIPDFPEQKFDDSTLSAAASMNEMAQALGTVASQDTEGSVKSSLELCLLKLMLNFKEVLTLEESAIYCDLSVSRMYKLSCENQLHFSKPGGKRAYISRASLNDWMLNKQISPVRKMRH
ncbi:MAG: helix-turn-helix domain-containing protein [Pararheinheimera sp.]|nr:helix-turn-helix domain-containing protein [Rheinheimera sp.]